MSDPFQGPTEEDMELRGLDLEGNKLVICPYCENKTEWVSNEQIYGRRLGRSYMIWLCHPCDAYVGCHKNSRNPLGTLANAVTRKWRQLAHQMFDPLWRENHMSRLEAYQLLNKKLKGRVHMGKADVKQCKEIIHLCNSDPEILQILGGKK